MTFGYLTPFWEGWNINLESTGPPSGYLEEFIRLRLKVSNQFNLLFEKLLECNTGNKLYRYHIVGFEQKVLLNYL